MAVLSKSFGFSCYDIVHPLYPSCIKSSLSLARHTWAHSIKLYTTLYFVSSLVQRKLLKPEQWSKILIDILRSSCFLTWNASGYLVFLCTYRKLTKAWYPHSFVVPAFFVSLSAIGFERPSRRKALTVYMLNTASQILYIMLRETGAFRPIPNGEVLIFSLSMAAFLYFYKKQSDSKDLVSTALRFLIGPSEGAQRKTSSETSIDEISIQQLKPSESFKHKLCIHKDNCIIYFIKGFIRPFCVGYFGSVLVKVLTSLGKLRKHPAIIFQFLVKNIQLGLFLGLFSCSYKGLSCILRWTTNSDNPNNSLIAGFLAGWSMVTFKSPALASYVFWKLAERLCSLGIKTGLIPTIPFATEVIFSMATAFVFHVAFLHPDFVHNSYWKFLSDVTDKRWVEMNRVPFREWTYKEHERYKLCIKPDSQHMSKVMKMFLNGGANV